MRLRPITVDVRLVPMLVPITTGIPLKSVTIVKLFITSSGIMVDIKTLSLKDTCSTVIVSEATIATTREVVAEEDCSRDVAKIPMASLDNDIVVVMILMVVNKKLELLSNLQRRNFL